MSRPPLFVECTIVSEGRAHFKLGASGAGYRIARSFREGRE